MIEWIAMFIAIAGAVVSGWNYFSHRRFYKRNRP